MKKSSFEPSTLWAIFLCVFIFALGFFGGYLYTDSSLRVDNATLRADLQGGRTAEEERKALEKREEEVKRRENNADQRDKDQDRRESELNSAARSTGKAEGKAEQLSKNNEVIKQSFDGVLWQRNILLIILVVGSCVMFLHIRKLQYLIDDRDKVIEVMGVQIRSPFVTIEQIKTVFETSTHLIDSKKISNQKLLKSSNESEEYTT